MAGEITIEDLRTVPLLADEPEEHLAWLAEQLIERRYEAGEVPFRIGEEARHLMIILEGLVHIYLPSADKRRFFRARSAGDFSGRLPYSRMTHYGGDTRVVEPTRLALLEYELVPPMLYRMPDLGESLVAMMSDRVRAATRGDQQREKMVALGKLSAGLTHELNNPAAAVRSSAASLRARLRTLHEFAGPLATGQLSPDEWRVAERLREKAEAHEPDLSLSALARSEREDDLGFWLEDCGVDEAWTLSAVLADVGLTPDDLEEAAAELRKDAVGPVIAWVAAALDADRLLEEIDAASERISDLVASVKAYSHVDRSPEKQDTDLRAGLENTLTMLGHRLRKKSIDVERTYAPELPTIQAHPGELNQVWTNLIDNAIDALDEGGTLRIVARLRGGMVSVSITDDGAGIPPDVLERIFEPFYSTKDVGEGTGLGLEVVDRIVHQHGGDIRVESERGATTFEVLLPTAGG